MTWPRITWQASTTSGDTDDSEIYIDQARWVIEWHNKRSDGFATRAVALLGFTGVTLTLLLQGIKFPGLKVTEPIAVVLVATVALLFACAFCCIRVFASVKSQAPDIDQFRDWWKAYYAKPIQGKIQPQVAETYLLSKKRKKPSLLEAARSEADQRGRWFKRATVAMLLAMGSLAALVVLVSTQTNSAGG